MTLACPINEGSASLPEPAQTALMVFAVAAPLLVYALLARRRPSGAVAEALQDPERALRTRLVGLIAAVVPLVGVSLVAALLVKTQSSHEAVMIKFLASSLLPALVAARIARAGGRRAAEWAQAVGLSGGGFSRSGPRRALGGGLIGLGYGAFTGFFAGLVSMALFLPVMSLLTGDPPSSRELYPMFLLYSGACAFLGATVGALVLAPLAVISRRAQPSL